MKMKYKNEWFLNENILLSEETIKKHPIEQKK